MFFSVRVRLASKMLNPDGVVESEEEIHAWWNNNIWFKFATDNVPFPTCECIAAYIFDKAAERWNDKGVGTFVLSVSVSFDDQVWCSYSRIDTNPDC
jgi:6-pyruvoyl-tetrahydropterin synthase